MWKRVGSFVLVTLSLILWNCGSSDGVSADDWVEEKDTIPHKTDFQYGFVLDSFQVVRGKVKKNQFFSDLLLGHHIGYPTIDRLVKEGKPVFDVRKMRADRPYTVLCSNDSVKKAQVFVYEINKVDYVVYDMRDTLKIYKKSKPVHNEERKASGVIYSSLYKTMKENNINPLLSNKLAEIYAWTIDFYRIQKGDKFKVIYDEIFVDSVSVGIGTIREAVFTHNGHEFYAIRFTQNGLDGYYDVESRGLKRQFLKAPVKYSRISSRYSPKRFHPVQKRFKAHLGTDYAAPTGTPIFSTANGKVIAVARSRYNGKYVKVKHNSVYTTQYLHMSRHKKGLRVGQYVKQGDIIGYVGSTGLATGPHVCYRFWKNGKQVDPYRQKLPKSEPIKKANLPLFKKIKDEAVKKLEAIPYPEKES